MTKTAEALVRSFNATVADRRIRIDGPDVFCVYERRQKAEFGWIKLAVRLTTSQVEAMMFGGETRKAVVLRETAARLAKLRSIRSSFINVRLDRIEEALESIGEHVAEAGPHGKFCPFLRETIDRIATDGFELVTEIEDQLSDWDNT